MAMRGNSRHLIAMKSDLIEQLLLKLVTMVHEQIKLFLSVRA